MGTTTPGKKGYIARPSDRASIDAFWADLFEKCTTNRTVCFGALSALQNALEGICSDSDIDEIIRLTKESYYDLGLT